MNQHSSRVRISAFLALGTLAVASLGAQADRPVQDPRPLHSAWDRILGDHVHGERIDYLGLSARSLPALDGYLDRLAKVEPDDLGPDERLAFYINLYNASMVRAVLDRYERGWTATANDSRVFKADTVRLEGKPTSLDHLEHEIIRKQFDEPRIHVALVCGAVSCPPILDRAWKGETLDATLEARMRAFVKDTQRNRVRAEEAKVSKIFEWFRGDFTKGGGTLIEYLRQHGAPQLEPGAEISFLEYDWSLNITDPAAGEWFEFTGEGRSVGGRTLEKGDVVLRTERSGDEVRVRTVDGRVTGTVPESVLTPFRLKID